MPQGQRFGEFSRVLAGLPYDVQAQLYAQLSHRRDINPDTLYRLPMIHATNRLTIAAGGTVQASWRISTLSAIYGLSASFSNETGTAVPGNVSTATLAYRDEVTFQIQFNQGQTSWIGQAGEPVSLSSIGDGNHVTRMDPIVAHRQDVWDLSVTGDAGLVNNIFTRMTLHGVQIYSASGAI
jgi:hypothetical protein